MLYISNVKYYISNSKTRPTVKRISPLIVTRLSLGMKRRGQLKCFVDGAIFFTGNNGAVEYE